MARKYFSVASFNVRNLISADVTYYGDESYSPDRYRQKIGWLANQLLDMNADVVALQEVFDEASVKDLVAAYGELVGERLSARSAGKARYKHVRYVPNVNGTADDPRPGLAIISRRKIVEHHGIQDLVDDPVEIEPDAGLTYRLDRLSRPLQMAKIDLGEGVQAWFFNAHLKSKRPTFPEGSTAGVPSNFEFLGRAEGSFRSLARRAGEALALRRVLLEKLIGSAEPVIVLGDLNDEIGAVTTEMVSGEIPFRAWPFSVKKGYWDVELYSAVRSHLRRTEEASIYTHIYNGHYGTIDHVLVSQEFYYRNRDRIGDIHFAQVYNDHLVDYSVLGAPSMGSASDHGQVVVRLSIDTDRLAEQAKRRGEYELTRDEDGRFRFVLRAGNGEVIAESQAYRSRAAALRGIESVRANAWRADVDDQS